MEGGSSRAGLSGLAGLASPLFSSNVFTTKRYTSLWSLPLGGNRWVFGLRKLVFGFAAATTSDGLAARLGRLALFAILLHVSFVPVPDISLVREIVE